MIIAGRRIPKGNILLLFSFTAISVCLLLIVCATRAERRNTQSQNGLYTGHQKRFSIGYATKDNLWEDVIPKLTSGYHDFAIYVPLEDPNIVMRGIFVQGEVESPPMLQGSYFDASTSWSGHPTLVLGKQFQKDIRIRNHKMYYTYQGVEYEVIGIMGTEDESRINHMIMMDFKSAVRITGINTQYMLDTKKESHILSIGQAMCRQFHSPAEVVIMLQKGEYKEPLVTRLFSSDVILDTMYVMIFISFFLSTILVTFIWLRLRWQLLFACSLFGYEKRFKRLEIAKRFYLVAGVGFATGLLLLVLISRMVPDIHMIGMDVLQAFGMTIGLGSVILFFCYALAG